VFGNFAKIAAIRYYGDGHMRTFFNLFSFVAGLFVGVLAGAALLAYSYQEAGLYPPDDATIKFLARERGWLRDDVQ
jgi:hypothetical protein